MAFLTYFALRLQQLRSLGKWLLIVTPLAVIVGSLVAGFLWSLDTATSLRFDNGWLIYFMPVAGIAMVWAYQSFGKSAEGGNNLIVDQIHEPGGGVPLRMAPFILLTTVLTHLVGGSAGREGTAVQMGGSVASAFGRLFGLSSSEVRILLMAGIAAGFGAVFGTPIAGAVFALEVITIGRVQYEALLPALLSAIVADWTTRMWGVGHVHYAISFMANAGGNAAVQLDPVILVKVAIAGLAFGLAARLFVELSHSASSILKTLLPFAPLRPVLASVIILGLVYLLGTRQYLGLGVWSNNPADVTIQSFFQPGYIDYWSWAWKGVFTVVTLSAGFKGGEVTPLFFIGAGLGSALAGVLGAPPDLFAGLGFVAVFAGATNTPLACLIMGIELFGATHAVYLAVACFVAYLSSGHSGIYLSQRVGIPKTVAANDLPPDIAIRQVRDLKAGQFADMVRTMRPSRSAKKTPVIERSVAVANHVLNSKEIGMIGIYIKPRERTGGKGLFGARLLYRELVTQAKAAGILNAVAHHTHFGYSNHGSCSPRGWRCPIRS